MRLTIVSRVVKIVTAPNKIENYSISNALQRCDRSYRGATVVTAIATLLALISNLFKEETNAFYASRVDRAKQALTIDRKRQFKNRYRCHIRYRSSGMRIRS